MARPTWPAIFLVGGNTVVCIRRPRAGRTLYALLALTAPLAAEAGVKVRYEMAALPLSFLLCILFFGGFGFRRGRLYGYPGVAPERVVHRSPMSELEAI